MKNEGTFRNITNFIPLLVFTLLAVCVLAVLLTGAGIYNRLTDQGQVQYDRRTLSRYLTTRIRQADEQDAVFAETTEDTDALVLRETIDNYVYETRIYCCNGYLREMFCEAGAGLPPEFGEEILPMEDFSVICEDNLVRAELLLTDGTKESLILLLRSNERGSS